MAGDPLNQGLDYETVERVALMIGDGYRRQAIDLVRHLRRVKKLGGSTDHYAWAELRGAAQVAITRGLEGAAIVFVVAWCERVAADA